MCKTCTAKLVFTKNDQGLWDLKRHNLDHTHNLGKEKTKASPEVIKGYENFIKAFPVLPERAILLKTMKNLYDIPEQTFYKVYNRVLAEFNQKTF